MTGCCRSPSITEVLLVALLGAGLTAAACRTAPFGRPGEVRIAGSDSMLSLNRRLAAAYMRDHPGVAIRVSGGGTGEGVRRLLDSEADLCAASRPFRADEIQALNRGFGTLGIRYLIARDALSVYVHPSNPLTSLTVEQISDLFSGRVTRWSELGGADLPVRVVIRPPSSGTHHFFRDHVLGGRDWAADVEMVGRVVDVIERVAAEEGAIGFGDLAHHGDVVGLRVDGVAAAAGTVRGGDYPLARYLYYYAVKPPEGALRAYLDWCLGPDGQRLVEEVGFIALWVSD